MTLSLPGPATLRTLRALRRDPLSFVQGLQREHGDVASFSLGGLPTVLVSHPDAVGEVLVSQRDAFIKDRGTRALGTVLGQGLLTAEGETWKRQRRVAAPSLRPRHLAVYAEAMVRSARERPPGTGEVDVHEWLSALTLDIVLRTLFGVEPGDEASRVGPLLGELTALFEARQHSVWRLVPEWVPNPHRARATELATELDRLLATTIAGHDPGGDDLLARLLAARDDDGSPLTETEVRDAALTLFLAGHETTALALTSALWLLAEHPEEQERARAEVAEVLGDAEPTAADVRRLPFLDAVVSETLRLLPPAWAFGREVVRPVTLGGQPLAVGTQVVMSPWVLHRDARWWIGPTRFRPERWRNGETDALLRHTFVPFGGGPRVCIGNHFARMELVLVLAMLLREQTFAPVPGFVPSWAPAVTLRPTAGLPLVVSPRRG
jgi:cytochrome P450